MKWGGSNPTDRILRHLAEIGAGRCTITEDSVVAEADPDMSQVLLGLLVLHEDLTYASQQRTEAEARLRGIADERERLLEERRAGDDGARSVPRGRGARAADAAGDAGAARRSSDRDARRECRPTRQLHRTSS